MDAGEVFAVIVTMAVGVLVIVTVQGGDPSGLINILPKIVVAAFILAFVIALLNIINGV